MIKHILPLLVLVLLISSQLMGQTYVMQSGSNTTCSGTFYDPGGTGNYANNLNRTQTFYPSTATSKLQVSFSQFNTENCCDRLTIYNGSSTAAPVIGVYRGTTSPGTITSTAADGSLTFRFTSDGSVTSSGWRANFSCCSSVSAGTITSSASNIYGGATIQLQSTGACGGLVWESSSDGNTWTTIASTQTAYTSYTPNRSLYYRAIASLSGASDTSNTVYVAVVAYNMSSGVAYTCNANFYDAGGSGNYSNNESRTQTFYPDNNNSKLRVRFNSFSTENCCDRLTIYNGSSTAAPVIGVYRGTTSPGTITSTAADGSLTFRFTSDGSVTSSGWRAEFFCCDTASSVVATASKDTVCIGESFQLYASNYCNNMQWQESTDNLSWADIAGAIQTTYTHSQSTPTYYRGILNTNGTLDTTNVVFVFIDTVPVIGGATTTMDTVCIGQTFQLGLTGYKSCIQMQWQQSSDNLTWSNIAGATNAVENLSQTASSYYRAIGTIGTNTDTSTVVYVFTNTIPQAGLITANTNTICGGLTFQLDITGSSSCASIQWQRSIDSLSWTNIGGNNTTQTTSQGASNYYRAVVALGNNSDTSNVLYITTDCYQMGDLSSATTCSGYFYDEGGVSGSYGNNRNQTQTFYPSTPNSKLGISFNSFSTESGYDYLVIYNGSSTSAPILGTYSGTSLPGTITSTAANGSLTFRFVSDGSSTRSGWSANFFCCQTPSGGVASSSINNICAGEDFELRVTGQCGNLVWERSTDSLTWTTLSGTSPIMTISQLESSYYRAILTLNGNSDTSTVVYVSTDCYKMGDLSSATTCSGYFYDEGGVSGSYGSNRNQTQTFYPSTPNSKLGISFNSFSTESGYDYLVIYNGSSTSAPILGTYSGTSLPGTITSTAANGSLTFRFVSDGSTTRSGWSANFFCCQTPSGGVASSSVNNVCAGEDFELRVTGQCGNLVWERSTDSLTWTTLSGTSPIMTISQLESSYYRAVLTMNGNSDTSTVVYVSTDCYKMGDLSSATTCSGYFYDEGGVSGSYGSNRNQTQTFYPSTPNSKLGISFNSFSTESGYDYLVIYNGSSTSAPILGTYSGTSLPGSLTSTAANGSLTFRFVSDGSTTRSGWSANFFCCQTASGGAASSSVNNVCAGEDFELRVTGQCGNLVWERSTDSLTWTTVSGTRPVMTISQLESSYYRAVLTMNGNSDTSTVVYVSTDCYKMGDLSSATTCSGYFYDEGGVSGSYGNNRNQTQTFYPATPTSKLGVSFNSFSTENCCDYLVIYNGSSTSAPILGTYRGTSLPGSLTSTAADGSLTFRFVSDGSSTRSGWSANFFCCQTPSGGVASSSVNNVCAGEDFELRVTGQCGNLVWERSTDSLTWTTVSGTRPIITTNQLESSYYRAVLTMNGNSDTSNTIYVYTDCYRIGDLSSATTCGGYFYDAGGPNSNYSNNENRVQTFYPLTATGKVMVTFSDFATESCCDRLVVYNGSSTSAPVIGTYQGTVNIGSITSTAVDGSLTFRFISDGSTTSRGWSAYFSCDCGASQTYVVTHTPLADVCTGQGLVALSGGNPIGGVYSGLGVVNGNSFDPAIAGAGTHTLRYAYTNNQGCTGDTTVTIHVAPSASSSLNASICQGDTYYFGGIGYTTAGTYYKTEVAANGCDSVVTLQLTIDTLPQVTHATVADICVGGGALTLTGGSPVGGTYAGLGVVNGTSFDPSLAGPGTHTVTYAYTNGQGCTGSTGVTINVLGNSQHIVNQAICQGDSYTFRGVTYTAAGVYSDTLVGSNGCDSIVSLQLTINPLPQVSHSVLAPVCLGQGTIALTGGNPSGGVYTGQGIIGGNTLDPSIVGLGSHNLTYSYTDNLGCTNSTAIMVNVIGGYNDTTHQSICQGDAYFWGGIAYTTTGIYTDTLTSSYGCDSIVHLDLTVNPLPQVSHSALAPVCLGQGLTTLTGGIPVGGIYLGQGIVGGTTFDPSIVGLGSHNLTYSYTDNLGCTNTTAITVNVIGGSSSTSNASICQGDTYVWRNNNYTTAGVYYDTLLAANGCDSILSLNLTIIPLPQLQIVGLDTGYCDTAVAVTVGVQPVGGILTGPGLTGYVFDPSAANLGSNTITYTYTDSSTMCTNTITTTVNVNNCMIIAINSVETGATIQIYPNPTTGRIIIDAAEEQEMDIVVLDEGGRLLQNHQVHASSFPIELTNYAEGVYFVRVTTAHTSVYQKVILLKP